ncbi:hypothetical protein, partial [Tessaracoccus sp. OH4464_COT-324]|uniref:hypothetical protein n=1 Tax=Tessaracoccus sp. OH4464_COT-324 TaxID=2491059 RepID=UPI001F29F101
DIPSPTLTLDPWMIDPTKPGWQDDKRWAGQPPPAIIPRIFPAHIQDDWPIPDLTNVVRAGREPPRTVSIGAFWIYVHKDDDTPYYQRRRIIHVSVDYFHDSYPLKVEDFVNPKAVGKAYCSPTSNLGLDTCLMVAQDCIIEFTPIGPWEGDVNAQMEQLMLELAAELRKHFGTDDQ